MHESWHEPLTKTFPQSRSLPAQEKFQGRSAFLRTRSLRTPVWGHRAIILSPVSWSSGPQGSPQAYLTSRAWPSQERNASAQQRKRIPPFSIPHSTFLSCMLFLGAPPPPSIDWPKEDGSFDGGSDGNLIFSWGCGAPFRHRIHHP